MAAGSGEASGPTWEERTEAAAPAVADGQAAHPGATVAEWEAPVEQPVGARRGHRMGEAAARAAARATAGEAAGEALVCA